MKKKRKYIYLEKCLIIRILQIYIFSFYDFLFFISLSYAKMLKNTSKHFICRYITYNITQMKDAFAQVLRDEIAGEVCGQSFLHAPDILLARAG